MHDAKDAVTKIIENHHSQLCEALKGSVAAFLSELHSKDIINREEKQIIEHLPIDQDKMIKTLEILKYRDKGFLFVIHYLRKNDMSNLADKLLSPREAGKFANLTFPYEFCNDDNSLSLEKLKANLINFYLGNYRAVESFGEEEEAIDIVWVKVRLEKNFHSSEDYNEIFARMDETNCRIAVVKGQPGSGKTVLVKKIAYDWAQSKKATNEEVRFDLVLAVPLRKLDCETEPLEMALTHYCRDSTSKVPSSKIRRIFEFLKQSSLKILVILDGLDEYQFMPNSFLGRMFSSVFTLGYAETNITPIEFSYHLLVTSRPYACQTINENLLTHKWEIGGLTEARQKDFVRLRCKTAVGTEMAIKYLEASTVLREISEMPLLLLFVCFLSDRNMDIPSNLTCLYEQFVFQMLKRFATKRAVGIIDPDDWRKSELIAGLGRLGLLGVLKNKFEFSSRDMSLCKVEPACCASGLLLYKSDPLWRDTKFDFPHRSIQEFLTALYSVCIWPTTSTIGEATGWPDGFVPIEGISEVKVEMLVVKTILFGDSQFCRFYFGLLSGKLEFEIKIRESMEEYVDIRPIVPHFLCCLSSSLADCSDAECLATGEVVNSLVEKSFNWIKSGGTDVQVRKRKIYDWTEEKTMINWPNTPRTELRYQLQSGLKLQWFKNSRVSYYLRGECQNQGKLIFLSLDEANLSEKAGELRELREIEWLHIWQSRSFDFDNLKVALEVINLLPKCRNCRISDDSKDWFFIRVWLEKKLEKNGRKMECAVNADHSGANPEFVYLGVEKNLGEKIFSKLSLLSLTNSHEVDVDSIERARNAVAHVRLAVISSWSVWNFLLSDGDWDGRISELSTARPQHCSLC